MAKMGRGDIILGMLASALLSIVFCLIPASTGSIVEAGETNGSGQIFYKGFISGAGGSYLAADPAPDIAISPANYDWGNLWVGFSDALEVTMTNGGTDVLTITDMTLSDTENFTFTANAGNDPCGDMPITLEAGTSCTFFVTFRPQSEATYSAALSIDCDVPDTPPAVIALTGTGVPNGFPFGDGNYSVNVDGGCSIVYSEGEKTGGFGAYGLLVLAASWYGIRRKRNETENANNPK